MTLDPQLSDLLDNMSALLGRRDLLLRQEQDWAAGSATGGPNSDGAYPIDDSTGFTRLIPSPAKLATIADDYTSSLYPDYFDSAAGTGTGHDDAPALQAMFDEAAATGKVARLRAGKVYLPAKKLIVDPVFTTFFSNGSEISFAQKTFVNPATRSNVVQDPSFSSGSPWIVSPNNTLAPTYGNGGLVFNDPPDATNQQFLEIGQQITAPAGSTLRVSVTIGEIVPVTQGINTFRTLYVAFRKDTGNAQGSIAGGGVSGAAQALTPNDSDYAPGYTKTWDVVIATDNPYLRLQTNAGVTIRSISVLVLPDNTGMLMRSATTIRGATSRGFFGLKLTGPGGNGSAYADAIAFDTEIASQTSRANFFGLNVGPSWGRGLLFQNRMYLADFFGAQVTASVACVDTLPGAIDAGENISFFGGNMGGGSTAGSIGIRNTGGFSIHCFGMSIDFSDQWYVGTGGCLMDQCWLEKNPNTQSGLPYIDLQGGYMKISKTRVQVDGSTDPTTDYPFMVARNAVLDIEADTPYNLHGKQGALCGGEGRFIFRGIGGLSKSLDPIAKRGADSNILGASGSFEDDEIAIPVWVKAQSGQQQLNKYILTYNLTRTFTADVAQGERVLRNPSVGANSGYVGAIMATSGQDSTAQIMPLPTGYNFTGDTKVGSNVITNLSLAPTSAIANNKYINCDAFPIGAKVIAYDNAAKTLTLDRGATAAGTGVAISTGNMFILSQPWNGPSTNSQSITVTLPQDARSAISLTSEEAHSGTQCLSFYKINIGASPWLCFIAIPIEPGRSCGMEFWYKVPPIPGSTSTTAVYFQTFFAHLLGADRAVAPTVANATQFISDLPQSGIDLSKGTDWTLVQSSSNTANVNTAHDGYAPPWATHMLLSINLSSVPAGFKMYVDDVHGNLM